MELLKAVLLIAGAYFYSSINLAVILSKKVGGFDIREVGTGKAGTANTMRNLGRGWGVLVFLFDLSKGILPLMLAGDLPAFVPLAAAGAAVTGHCRPVYYQFRGGGGAASVIGAMVYLMPGETLLSLAAAFILVQILLRRARYRIGQWVPVLFLALLPIVSLISAADLFGVPQLGGIPWYYPPTALGFGILVLLFNRTIARQKLRRMKGDGP